MSDFAYDVTTYDITVWRYDVWRRMTNFEVKGLENVFFVDVWSHMSDLAYDVTIYDITVWRYDVWRRMTNFGAKGLENAVFIDFIIVMRISTFSVKLEGEMNSSRDVGQELTRKHERLDQVFKSIY